MQTDPAATAVEWINATSTVVVAVATVVLAVTTFLSLRRERRLERRKKRVVDARICATAHQAMNAVLRAINRSQPAKLANDARMIAFARRLRGDLGTAVEYTRQMALEAPEGSEDLGQQAGEVFRRALRTKTLVDSLVDLDPEGDVLSLDTGVLGKKLAEVDDEIMELGGILDSLVTGEAVQ